MGYSEDGDATMQSADAGDSLGGEEGNQYSPASPPSPAGNQYAMSDEDGE